MRRDPRRLWRWTRHRSHSAEVVFAAPGILAVRVLTAGLFAFGPLAVGVVGLAIVEASPAGADPVLIGSSPASGAVVTAPIDAIVLRFDRALRRIGVRVSWNGGPLVVPLPQRGVDPAEAVIPVAGLPNGRYTTEFDASAVDGTSSNGQISFTVRITDSPSAALAPGTVTPSTSADATPPPTVAATTSTTAATTTPSVSIAPTGTPLTATIATTTSIAITTSVTTTTPGAGVSPTAPTTTRGTAPPTTRRRSTTTSTAISTGGPDTAVGGVTVPAAGTIAFPPTTVRPRRSAPTTLVTATTPDAPTTTRASFNEPSPVPIDLQRPTSLSSTPPTTVRLTLGDDPSRVASSTVASESPENNTTVEATATPGRRSSTHSGRGPTHATRRVVLAAVGVWLAAAGCTIGSVFTRRRRRQIAAVLRSFLWATLAVVAVLAVTALSRLGGDADLVAADSLRVGATIAGAVAMLGLAALRAARGHAHIGAVLRRETPDAWWERWRTRRVDAMHGRSRHTDVVTRRLRVLTTVEVTFAAIAVAVLGVLAFV